jgi:hypothetical protein
VEVIISAEVVSEIEPSSKTLTVIGSRNTAVVDEDQWRRRTNGRRTQRGVEETMYLELELLCLAATEA